MTIAFALNSGFADLKIPEPTNTPSQDCLLPGNGTMDYPRLLRQLKQQDYHGSFIIEVYRRNFEKLEELNSSAMYLNEKLSKYFG